MQWLREFRSSLGAALATSVLLHALLLLASERALRSAGEGAHDSAPAAALPLLATLQPSSAAAPPPSLHLPPPVAPARSAAVPVARPAVQSSSVRPAPSSRLPASSAPVARQALEQLAEHLLYPLEAIDRGIEGEVLLLVFVDASGTVVAARVERSSGHAILDQAAVAAARRLRALPAAATQFELPVRFRLD